MPSAACDDGEATALCGTCKEVECHISGKKGQHKINTKWIVCDLCSEWYHGMCQDLQNSDIGFLVKNDKKGIKWFCSDCCPEIESAAKDENKGLHKLTAVAANKVAQNKLSNIESMINKSMTAASSCFEERMGKLEKSYAEAQQSSNESIKQTQEINYSAKAILKKTA